MLTADLRIGWEFMSSYPPHIKGVLSALIAATAIARKLLTRAYHLFTDASSGGAPH